MFERLRDALTETIWWYGFVMVRDTSPHAARLQAEIHRRFRPAERLEMAIEMSEFARELARSGLRSRFPSLTEHELERELTRRIYGTASRRDD